MTRRAILTTMTSLALMACGLGVGEEPDCLTSDDCGPRSLCRLERCVSSSRENTAPTPSVTVTTSEPPPPKPAPSPDVPDAGAPETIDLGAGEDAGSPDSSPGSTPCGRDPAPSELALNELLVNVPAGPEGDANGDGERDAYHDEFIELVNASSEVLEVTGVTISNGERVKFTAPTLCLEPGQALVVFGGPKGGPLEATGFGARAYADSRFGFSNTAGVVRVSDKYGRALVGIAYEDPPAASYLLEPEVTGGHYVAHPAPSLSPGSCASGAALETGCVE